MIKEEFIVNWFSTLKPKLPKLTRISTAFRNLWGPKETLWTSCTSCQQMILKRDMISNLYECYACQYLLFFPARERLHHIFGENISQKKMELNLSKDKDATSSWKEMLSFPEVLVDPLNFQDQKKYSQRIKDAQIKTHEKDAIITAEGYVDKYPLVVSIMNFEFIGGSMGLVVGEHILQGSRRAQALRCPYLVITASGGARMQEGVYALMQMPKTVLGFVEMKAMGFPVFILMTHPTTGGVSASFASLGDITWAESGALIGFTGKRVIEETLRTTLPADFQTSEFQKKHGFIDEVIPRSQFRHRLLSALKIFYI
jgi:acetyl-CoA carboxylase carboxyl transferase subunit beta